MPLLGVQVLLEGRSLGASVPHCDGANGYGPRMKGLRSGRSVYGISMLVAVQFSRRL